MLRIFVIVRARQQPLGFMCMEQARINRYTSKIGLGTGTQLAELVIEIEIVFAERHVEKHSLGTAVGKGVRVCTCPEPAAGNRARVFVQALFDLLRVREESAVVLGHCVVVHDEKAPSIAVLDPLGTVT